MKQTNIAIVSYQNTIPFLYGLLHSDIDLNVNLLVTPPFECAENFINNKAEIALVPSVKLLEIEDYRIISDYCIGASDNVYSVALFSNSPKETLTRIYLDTDSRTSAALLKILARDYWNISPEWIDLKNVDNLSENEGCLLIGDKVFEHENKFSYKYDLSKEWLKYTGKQFVFALWIAKKSVSEHVEQEINSALKFGVENITNAVEELGNNIENSIIDKYLKENIEFELSQNKFEGLKLFLSKVKDPSPNH